MTVSAGYFLEFKEAVLKNFEVQHELNKQQLDLNKIAEARIVDLEAKAVEQQITIDRLSVDVLNIEDNLGI